MTICYHVCLIMASLVAQTVKNPPEMQETWVSPLGWKDPLEKGMETSIFAWRIPLTEDSDGLQSIESKKSWIQFSDQTTTR